MVIEIGVLISCFKKIKIYDISKCILVLMQFFFNLCYCYLKMCFIGLVSIHQIFGILNFRNSKLLQIFLKIMKFLISFILLLFMTSFFNKTHKTACTLRQAGNLLLLRGRSLQRPGKNAFSLHPESFPRSRFMSLCYILFDNYILLEGKSEHP